MKALTRRVSVIAAVAVAIMLAFSNVAYADEEPADAEPVAEATEENAEESETEAVPVEAEPADAEPASEPVEIPAVAETIEETHPVAEPPEPVEEVIPAAVAPATEQKFMPPAEPVKPAKSKLDNAVDRIKAGKDISDLGVSESETDALLSLLTAAGLIKSGEHVEFFVDENGKVISYEIEPDSHEEKPQGKTAKKASSAPATVTQPTLMEEISVSESSVPVVQKRTQEQPQNLPEEQGAEEPIMGFVGVLVLLAGTAKEFVHHFMF